MCEHAEIMEVVPGMKWASVDEKHAIIVPCRIVDEYTQEVYTKPIVLHHAKLKKETIHDILSVLKETVCPKSWDAE